MKIKYFATGNKHKTCELSQLLGYEIQNYTIDLTEIQSLDTKAVSIAKAVEAYAIIGESVLIEDTGLIINSLNGLPGALVKWFMDTVGNQGICEMLHGKTDRSAVAVTVYAFVNDKTGDVITCAGETCGTIAEFPRGENGFGWDKIFIPDGYSKTFAEMLPEEKNMISQRAKASQALSAAIQ